MPSEDELRNALGQASAPNTLDAQRIIAHSRARRLPKKLAAGAVGVLAATGVFVVALQGLALGEQPSTISSLNSQADDSAAGSATLETVKRAPAENTNLCGAPVADVAPSTYGLQLDLEFAGAATVGTVPVEGTVRLTNTSDQRVFGTTAALPTITLSQNGTVLWHSNGAMIMSVTVVDLQPGESMQYSASFTPVRCEPQDDAVGGFRADLPALPSGSYQVGALIDFSVDDSLVTDGVTYVDLVSSPRLLLTLQQ